MHGHYGQIIFATVLLWGGGGGGGGGSAGCDAFYNVIVEDQAVESTVYWNTRWKLKVH